MNNSTSEHSDPFIAPRCFKKIQIVYEDQYLLVIDKPSGLLSLSGKNPLNKESVHSRLVQSYPSATLAHRLDFGTSGLMIVALNKTINAHLTKQFQAGSIVKNYIATLLGDLLHDKGVIDAPIAKAEFPLQKICRTTGKPAQSQYQVLERGLEPGTNAKITKVLFSPRTGRTHQLRIHSRDIGHPILGCDLYGLTVDGVNSQQLANRLMLHASKITFEHPVTGQRLCFTA
jgi:tRNA pseudouridine32 synthase/23S rRNA pseudouridine746 synthase